MYLDDGLSPQALFTDRNMQRSPNLLTTPAKPGIDADRSQNPQILGYSGDMDPYLLQHYQFDASGSFRFKQLTIQSASSGSIPIQFLLSQPELLSFSRQEMGLLQAPYSVAREELETLVSVDTGARLISLFRRFILPQYPIFSDSDPPAPQTSPPHLLAALYMVAQPFARFDDVLSIELAYEGLDNKALFNFITQSLLYESHDPNLSDAQTLILLTLRPSTNPLILESSFKWSLHGQLVSTSHSLGLHYDPSTWNIAPWQVALRRRLSCTVFALDKWLACSLGRPPLLARDAWLVTQVTNADSHMSGLSVDAWNNYTCIAQLGLLLGDVLGRLYTLRAVAETAANIHDTLDISKRLLEELASWHEQYQLLDSTQPGESTSTSTICTLGYHYVRMTIYRAIIRPIVADSHSDYDLIGNANQLSKLQEVVGFARTGLRCSTNAAAELVNNLKEEHFHIFWPHWSQVAFSSICFLDLLMAVSSPSTDEAVIWFRQIHTVRRQMRLKANMLPVLRLALLRIDAVYWKGVDKVLHLPSHVMDALQISMTDNAI
ncbi:hypothetical protein IQ06DRAFT_235692 [Phaeosphaeriaceae sp. SRC1lsM3a]|nr:hypothetical protein IQ06DRAFT_235692 [Stagonospora sp. SRC1lsM3a]